MKNAMNHVDCVILIVPPILVNGPIPGPAMLKSWASKHGYNIKILNPSIELFKNCGNEITDVWPYSKFDDEFEKKYPTDTWVKTWVEEALSYNPTFFGISLFAWSGEFFFNKITKYIRSVRPDIQIVLGGPGTTELCDTALENDLIDYYVVGDGERPLLNMLENKFDHPNLNTKKIDPLDNEEFQNLSPADYSDEGDNMEFYKSHKNYVIYATGSKGCIYDCSFCNVPAMMKHRFKNGKQFAKEIKELQTKYKPKYIELSDSLINGSLKMWRELITELARLNEEFPENIPSIVSHYRVRGPRTAKEWEFEMASKAGFRRLKMGIESGSPSVREHIGKKETNDDIFYTFEMCKKYNMKVTFLLIVGYPTETDDDFQLTMNMLKEIKDKDLDCVVEKFVINELYISQRTKLIEQVDLLGIKDIGETAEEKLARPWYRTLPDGKLLDNKVRTKRVATVKKYVNDNYNYTKNIILFSNEDTSVVTKNI